MRALIWTQGEVGPKQGLHKSVDLSSIRTVRLFRHAQPGVAAVVPTLNLLSKGGKCVCGCGCSTFPSSR